MNLPDFNAYCEDACIKLWGEPDKRSKTQLRWNGDANGYGGRSYDLRKRVWYDHDQKRGGRTLDLVAYADGKPKAEKLHGAEFFAAWKSAHERGWIPDPPPQPNGGTKWENIRERFPYPDENGDLLYEVVRFDTEVKEDRFRYRRPDGKGGWIGNIKGIRRVLYRLPQLIAAVEAKQRVLNTEGEKDAEAAVKLGYAATTNTGGVHKWQKDYDKFFRGADVVIIADNDAPGQAFAEEKARRLIGIAAHVRVVTFAQKDLSEWVAAGGTREQLDAIIDLTEEFTPPGNDEEARLLAELNRDYCVVKDGGKTLVLSFEKTEHEAGGERYTYFVPTFQTFQAFRDFYLNRGLWLGEGKEKHWVSLGSWWLTHPQRRSYSGLIFRPGDARESIDGKLNLWRGWGVEPKPGDWSLLREHMFEVLAAGDEEADRYNYNWLAWSVQNPGQQAGAALVLIGDPGTGKGTLGNTMCRIFGQHSLHISSAEDLTGKFNEHLRMCCFLFGDECYAPQDRRAEGQIKRVITESTLFIEPKGRAKIRVPNLLHVMLASNHDWVVPAAAHERRYAVQKVAETHRQEAAWFGPIYEQMRNGGYEAMLFELLHVDLGNWHPREIVHTAALAEQQEESLSPLDAWWLELLQTGVLAGADDLRPDRATSNRYEIEIVERDSGGGYGRSYDGGISSGYGSERKRTVWRDGLYDQARRISPKLKNATDAALGRHLSKQGCKGGGKGDRAVWVHRQRGWQFPPLKECRKRWNERFPDTVWDDTKDWTYPKDDPDVAAKERADQDDPF